MTSTNINGHVYCTHAISPHMVERNYGHIINNGSTAESRSYLGRKTYGATKAFVT